MVTQGKTDHKKPGEIKAVPRPEEWGFFIGNENCSEKLSLTGKKFTFKEELMGKFVHTVSNTKHTTYLGKKRCSLFHSYGQ